MSVIKNSVKNCNRSDVDVTRSAWSDLGNLFVDQGNKLGNKLTKEVTESKCTDLGKLC